MQNDKINLLITIDRNCIGPFRTMLKSIAVNNPGEKIHVWLLHSAIPQEDLQKLEEYCGWQGVSLTTIAVGRQMFENAPVSKRYPQEMYYRLLAPHLLPVSSERILYLDPDILVINPLRELWELNLQDKAFAAASHAGVTDIMNGINRVRNGVISAYHWDWSTFKIAGETEKRMLREILYNVSPMYHLDRKERDTYRDRVIAHHAVWSAFSKQAIMREMTGWCRPLNLKAIYKNRFEKGGFLLWPPLSYGRCIVNCWRLMMNGAGDSG